MLKSSLSDIHKFSNGFYDKNQRHRNNIIVKGFRVLPNYTSPVPIREKRHLFNINTADTDLLKMFHVEILLNFGNYFCSLKLGFWKFLSGIVFSLLFFWQTHSNWPKPRAFNHAQKSNSTAVKNALYFNISQESSVFTSLGDFRFQVHSWMNWFSWIFILMITL